MPRDHRYEDAFLDAVVAEAHRRANVDASPYAANVRHRLQIGADRYGDSAFLERGRDNLEEVCEEAPDIAGYALLELQALNQQGSPPDGVHHHLFEASVHAAIADCHARHARAARRGTI